MKFDRWRRLRSVEYEFRNSLLKICKLFNKIATSTQQDKQAYINAMNNFQNSYEYNRFVSSAVKRMVTGLYQGNSNTWREAARKATKGKMLYGALMEELRKGDSRIMQDQIVENISLIKTLPNDVATKVVKDIEEATLKGKRASGIEKIIRVQTDKHSRASARLIARTEVSKTTTALTKQRSEQLDLHWYVWRTALDGDRVRKSHRNMEDVLVNWNNPPSPEALVGEKDVGKYHAGNIWNCRCYPEPLLDVEDVKWPHKVYYNGSIQKMSKNQFEQLM